MLSISEAKTVASLYKGVNIHGKAIRLSFMYLGKRRLETLKNVALTKANIKAAYNMRASICHEIEMGKFDYIATFPNSKTAIALINEQNADKVLPLNVFLDKYEQHSKVNNRPMTHKCSKYRIDNYIKPAFGNRCITTIKVSEIKGWINNDLSHLSNKSICEVLIPLRAAFRYALDDELIQKTPMDLIVNPKKEYSDNADPFTRDEINKLTATETKRSLERDTLLFAIWTGVRPSELLAIAISDIDIKKKKLYIKRSIVRGNFASTKTDGSYRCIDLLDDAFNIIKKIIDNTKQFRKFRVNVLQPNNRLSDEEELQFIFTSSISGKFWSDSESFNKMFVKPHCKAAGVRYRGIGQARHTYGSQLITAGINLNWIAKQMGHKSIKMLEKHYGRWMESEVPNMAARVSEELKQLDS